MKDPPVDTDFLNDTQVLGLAQRAGALVVQFADAGRAGDVDLGEVVTLYVPLAKNSGVDTCGFISSRYFFKWTSVQDRLKKSIE